MSDHEDDEELAELRRINHSLELRLHEHIKALEAQAIELARTKEELAQFAYVISHDLQEPLRMISSYCQLLQRRYQGKLDADADEFIAYAVDGSVRMQKLINDLLAYSRVGRGAEPFEPVDCGKIVKTVLLDLQAAISESGAAIHCGDLPVLMGDRVHVTQIFQNLISNAIKFRNARPLEIQIAAERKAEDWLFSIRDNGIGIDPEYFERIFVIFQRLHTHQEYAGTGVGLAICKKAVEGHGGRIWVESEPGKGSIFYFTLPAAIKSEN